ncbi:MAG: hypothetical protein IJN83_06860 [Clostridia bacterium]|nr:hypothetical protein [Clostridia bacterium]
MTSEERREARYQRRKAKREEQKKKRNSMTYEEVFSFDNLYNAFNNCKQGVMWKTSVQGYAAGHLAKAYRTHRQLMDGTYKSKGFVDFDIMERGKPRHIRSVHISERVVQRCLCDHYLVPVLSSTFIYDNGASLKGKGIHFSLDRLCEHLRWHYRRYGTEGYVLTFDFSKYFDTAKHSAVFAEIDRCTTDERLREQAKYFIRQFGNEGLGLGSQVSQISALALPNKLDHYIKEKLRIRCYGRYMDDGYLIHPSKEYLQECLNEIRKICASLGIKLNERKTQITKLTKGVTFLKGRFFLTDSGKVVKKLNPHSVTSMRRKLKKFKKWVDCGKMSIDDVWTSCKSWVGYASYFDAYHSRQNLNNLYKELFVCTK